MLAKKILWRRRWCGDRQRRCDHGWLIEHRFRAAQKTIAALGDSLNVFWAGGGVAQYITQFDHRGVEAVIEVHERVLGPEALSQLFPRDNFLGAFQQRDQHLKRLQL